jgi:hypothetical protein
MGKGRVYVWGHKNSPSALACAILLGLFRVGVDMARLGKVSREMLSWAGCAISKTSMVTVVHLVCLAHY